MYIYQVKVIVLFVASSSLSVHTIIIAVTQHKQRKLTLNNKGTSGEYDWPTTKIMRIIIPHIDTGRYVPYRYIAILHDARAQIGQIMYF